MQYLNYFSKLTIQQILVFLAVAEHESISKAAEKCHMTHSAVSKNVQNMEYILGVSLFIRHRQRLKLTPAGKMLRTELQSTMQGLEQVFMRASATQKVEMYPLVIGIPSGISVTGYLQETLEYCSEMIAGFDYIIEGYYYSELPQKLMGDTIDVAISFGLDRNSYESGGMLCEELFTCPLVAYMREDDPLTALPKLTFRDLHASDFIFPYSSVGSTYSELLISTCREHGFTPRIGRLINTISYASINIRQRGQILVGDPFTAVFGEGIIAKELSDEETSILIARKKTDVNSLADTFIQCAQQYWSNHRRSAVTNKDCSITEQCVDET